MLNYTILSPVIISTSFHMISLLHRRIIWKQMSLKHQIVGLLIQNCKTQMDQSPFFSGTCELGKREMSILIQMKSKKQTSFSKKQEETKKLSLFLQKGSFFLREGIGLPPEQGIIVEKERAPEGRNPDQEQKYCTDDLFCQG